MMFSRFAVISGMTALVTAGGSFKMELINSAELLSGKARLPVAISKRTAPAAHRSLRGSATPPFNCSGAMYGSVPVSSADLVKVAVCSNALTC